MRKVGRKLLLAALTTVLVLALAEGSLWLVALLADRDWRLDPLPEHPPYDAVCQLDEEILYLCPEERFGHQRVRPEMFLREPDGVRVIAIGESFVHGLRLEAEDAWPAALERELGGDAEVLNWGRCGAYAGSLVSAVEGALALEPDLLVLAIGNNEHTMTSFYTGWPARHPVLFHCLSASLGRLQGYGLLARSLGADQRPQEKMEVGRSFDDPVEQAAYSARRRPPDLSSFEDGLASPEVTRLLEREQRLKERIFRARLDDLVRRAQDAGVPVLLATLPRDLRTRPVLSGVHGGDPARVRELVRAMSEEGDAPLEPELIQLGLDEDPGVAIFHFLEGQRLLALGQVSQAGEALRRAADWDLVPDSTPSLNAVVRDVAAARDLPLVDLAALSERVLAQRQDQAFFMDRVHVTAHGAEVVAAEVAPVVRGVVGSSSR